MSPAQPENDDLVMQVTEALRQYHTADPAPGLLDGLLLFRQALDGEGGSPRAANNRVLRHALAVLRGQQPAAADLLLLRYLDLWPVERVAARMNFAVATVFRRQQAAVRQLAGIVEGLEAAARRDRQMEVDHWLEVPSTLALVGVDDQVAALAERIAAGSPPWLASIEGIGGIGKTALAAALLRSIAGSPYFDNFAWVSAQPTILDARGIIQPRERPALSAAALVTSLLEQLAPQEAAGLLGQPEAAIALLRTVLRRAPHLVVIDNLETMVDVDAVLPMLRTLANPSKFVVTSRKRLIGESDIYLYPVPELSEASTLALVREAGARHNVPHLAGASDAELRPIYTVVGGNPLAILLVVGQLHVHSLDTVLADLQGARGAPVENLYAFIYRRAWENLDELQRRVLLAMSLVNVRGDSLDFVAGTAELPLPAAGDALQQLIAFNLVYPVGDLRSRCYAIHSLTRSFLFEQVARWAQP